jgi:hypothetical protein
MPWKGKETPAEKILRQAKERAKKQIEQEKKEQSIATPEDINDTRVKNTFENNIRILQSLTTVTGDVAEEIPGDAKDELDELIDAIESDKFQVKDNREYILKNLTEARKLIYDYNYRYAATCLNRVSRRLWVQVLSSIDQGNEGAKE